MNMRDRIFFICVLLYIRNTYSVYFFILWGPIPFFLILFSTLSNNKQHIRYRAKGMYEAIMGYGGFWYDNSTSFLEKKGLVLPIIFKKIFHPK